MHREDGDNIAAINANLIALVWGMIEQIKKILSYSLEFEILTHFQVVTSRHSNDEEPFCQREEISGWRIISSHDLAIEQAMARIADFQRKTGFSVETALSALDDALKEPKKSRGDRHAFLAKYLRERGHKITAPVVRSLLEDLNSTYDPRYIRFRND